MSNNIIIDIDEDVFWILIFFIYFDLLYNNLIEIEDDVFKVKILLRMVNFVYN